MRLSSHFPLSVVTLNPFESMRVFPVQVGQGMRVKRYSSQRNRQLPDGGGLPPGAPPLPSAGAGQHPGAPPPPGVPPSGAPPPMHMGLMEDAYYNPSKYVHSLSLSLSFSIECSLWLLVASLVGTRLCR